MTSNLFSSPPNNKEEYAWDTSTADQQASIKLMKKKKKKKNKKIQSVPRVSKKKKHPKRPFIKQMFDTDSK